MLLEGAVSERSLTTGYSYGRLAELLRVHSTVATDARELFMRMAFNVFIGNTDDHARNHAWLRPIAAGPHEPAWQLAPAYDVLPISASKLHGLGVGDLGRHGSIENLRSQASRFGLQEFKAKAIVNQVRELVAQWPLYMARFGVGDGDIERLRKIIPTVA